MEIQRCLTKLVFSVSVPTIKSNPSERTFFNYLIAMLSTFLFGRSGIYKHFLKYIIWLYIQLDLPCLSEDDGVISHCKTIN